MTVEVTKDAVIAGKDIKITATAPKLTRETISSEAEAVANTIVEWVYEKVKHVVKKVVEKVSKIPIIGWLVKKVVEWVEEWVDELVKHVLQSDAKAENPVNFTNMGGVVFNGLARVGGGTAGIFVDIFDADCIYRAGADASLGADWVSVDRQNEKVIIHRLYDDDDGSFVISAGVGTASGSGTVESNRYIPDMTIVNHSDLDLVLRELILRNDEPGTPSVDSSANGTDSFSYTFSEGFMGLNLTALGDTDIIFDAAQSAENRKMTDLGEGALTVSMKGGRLITTGGAKVAANEISVTGARQVGESLDNPFELYVFDIAEYPGMRDTSFLQEVYLVAPTEAKTSALSIAADGAVYLSLTPVREWTFKDQEKDPRYLGQEAAMNLDRVSGGSESMVYIKVNAPLSWNADKATEAEEYSISLPRTEMEFVALPDTEGALTFRQVGLKDADGVATKYYLSDDGRLMNIVDPVIISGGSTGLPRQMDLIRTACPTVRPSSWTA